LAFLRIGPDSEEAAFLLSGFIVASLAGSFFGALALRICNLIQIEVLELYSTFALSKGEIVSSMAFTYTHLALPPIFISIVVLAFTSPGFNPQTNRSIDTFISTTGLQGYGFIPEVVINYKVSQAINIARWFLV
ncbi:ABC-2 type transport system permease protein, partial [Candidatus Hakubella thermalkaliphila]